MFNTIERKNDVITNSEDLDPPKNSAKDKPCNPLGSITRLYRLVSKFLFIITHRWWWWELGAIVVSVTAMTVVLVILLKINNLALSSWTFPIQANSLVSVFMTASKTALLVPIAECISQAKWVQFSRRPQTLSKFQEYDEASRGPWGAAMLLLGTRRGQFAGWIASLGAVLTLTSLALDPFTQQILSFPSRQVALPAGVGTADMSSTQSLHTIDMLAMRGAILTSIYSPEQSPTSHFTYKCTTSSCVWKQTISSLGVCSVCQDIKPFVAPNCTTVPGPIAPAPGQAWSFKTTTCTYAISPLKEKSLQVHIQTLTLPAADGRPAEYASQYTQLKVVSQGGYGGSEYLGHRDQTLGDLVDPTVRWLEIALVYSAIYETSRPRMPDMTLDELAPNLYLCGVYLCERTYDQLAVVNGSLLLADDDDRGSRGTRPRTVPLGNIPADEKDPASLPSFVPIPGGGGQVAEVFAPRFNSSLINYEKPPSSSFSSPSELPTRQQVDEKEPHEQQEQTVLNATTARFTMSQQAVFALEGHLRRRTLNISQWDGNIDFGDMSSIFNLSEGDAGGGGRAPSSTENYGLDMDALRASTYVNKADDKMLMNDLFDRLARGITGRMWVENGNQVVRGEALVEETYFAVSWAWFSLPCGVLLGTGLLLGLMLMTTTRGGGDGGAGEMDDGKKEEESGRTKKEPAVGIWKGSSLAVLVCCDLDTDTGTGTGAAKNLTKDCRRRLRERTAATDCKKEMEDGVQECPPAVSGETEDCSRLRPDPSVRRRFRNLEELEEYANGIKVKLEEVDPANEGGQERRFRFVRC